MLLCNAEHAAKLADAVVSAVKIYDDTPSLALMASTTPCSVLHEAVPALQSHSFELGQSVHLEKWDTILAERCSSAHATS